MQRAVLDEQGNESPQGAREEPKVERVDISNSAFAVTDVRAKKDMQEVEDMCTRAQKIITSNPYNVKELLDQMVVRARALVVRFEGAARLCLRMPCSTRPAQPGT